MVKGKNPHSCGNLVSWFTDDLDLLLYTLLMEELPNNHLGCRKPCKSYMILTYQLVNAGVLNHQKDTVDGSEIPNNPLGYINLVVNDGAGVDYQPQLVSRISSISSMTDDLWLTQSEDLFRFLQLISRTFLPNS